MAIPSDLPTVVLTPVNEAIWFALWVGLVSSAVVTAIEIASKLKSPQGIQTPLIKFALFAIGLYGALFSFVAFVILGSDPVKPLEAVKQDVMIMAGSLIVAWLLTKVLPFQLFQSPPEQR
ncbi:MAG: hypothetical protein AAF050_25135 [Cyanobacteria bacterium J06649_5]